MASYVYLIKNNVNGNVYVGVSDGDLHRLEEHKIGIKSNSHLQRAIKVYGVENFTFVMLEEWPTMTRALEAETEMIVYLRALGATLYNMNDGGLGGINPTSELRAKISKNVKAALKHADLSFYECPKYRQSLSLATTASYTLELRQRRSKDLFEQWEKWRSKEAQVSPQRAYDVYKSAGDRYRRRDDMLNAQKCYAIANEILSKNSDIDTRVYRKMK